MTDRAREGKTDRERERVRKGESVCMWKEKKVVVFSWSRPVDVGMMDVSVRLGGWNEASFLISLPQLKCDGSFFF